MWQWRAWPLPCSTALSDRADFRTPSLNRNVVDELPSVKPSDNEVEQAQPMRELSDKNLKKVVLVANTCYEVCLALRGFGLKRSARPKTEAEPSCHPRTVLGFEGLARRRRSSSRAKLMSEIIEPLVTAKNVTLNNCDREQIHIPGAIQPHGAMLVVAEPGLIVLQASANCADSQVAQLKPSSADRWPRRSEATSKPGCVNISAAANSIAPPGYRRPLTSNSLSPKYMKIVAMGGSQPATGTRIVPHCMTHS